jgi:hypothetical protein
MKTLVKNILGAVAFSGIVLISVGSKIDNEKMVNSGVGMGITPAVYALIYYNVKKGKGDYSRDD